MVDIQCAADEIRRVKKIEDRKKPQEENIMACPIPQGGHNKDRGLENDPPPHRQTVEETAQDWYDVVPASSTRD